MIPMYDTQVSLVCTHEDGLWANHPLTRLMLTGDGKCFESDLPGLKTGLRLLRVR
jgi:hypothetical protein